MTTPDLQPKLAVARRAFREGLRKSSGMWATEPGSLLLLRGTRRELDEEPFS